VSGAEARNLGLLRQLAVGLVGGPLELGPVELDMQDGLRLRGPFECDFQCCLQVAARRAGGGAASSVRPSRVVLQRVVPSSFFYYSIGGSQTGGPRQADAATNKAGRNALVPARHASTCARARGHTRRRRPTSRTKPIGGR